MKTKPSELIFLTLFFVALSLFIPLQICGLYSYALWDLEAIANKIAPLNYLVIFSFMWMAYLSYNMSPHLSWAIPVCTFVVGLNNFNVAMHGANFSKGAALLSFLLFFGCQAVWLYGPIRALLKNPHNRWWITPQRQPMAVPVLIQTWLGESIQGITANLSKTGVLLELRPTVSIKKTHLQYLLQPGRQLSLRFVLGPLKVLKCDAEIVRLIEANGQTGVGLRFTNYYGASRREIQQLCV